MTTFWKKTTMGPELCTDPRTGMCLPERKKYERCSRSQTSWKPKELATLAVLLVRMERGKGGNWMGCGVHYQMECQMCSDENKSVYIGETSPKLSTRASKHLSRYRNGTPTSFIVKHQASEHQGDDPNYKAKVTASTSDCLTRQVREAVLIRRSQVNVLNGKTEWHQPAFNFLHKML